MSDPADVTFFQHAVEQYGYLAVLIGTFLEGETILVIGGIMAHEGRLDFWLVALVAFIGSLSGDQLWFAIGRRYGGRILAKRPKWQTRAQKIWDWLDRWQVPFILIFRFLYGLRSVAPFAIGMTRIPLWKYAMLNTIGAAVWAVAVTWIGYAIGHAFERVMEPIKQYQLYVFAAIGVMGVVFWLWRWRVGRRRAAVASNASQAEVLAPRLPGGLPSKMDLPPS